MKLFPQFSPVDNKTRNGIKDWEVLTELTRQTSKELELKRLSFNSDSFDFSSLGTKVEDEEIERLYEAMFTVAESHGYPASCFKKPKARQVDMEWGHILHTKMQISRNEASKAGVWNALACHYMPNLVAWRWQDPAKPSEKPSERWVTQDRQERHAFGRLWWRYEILKDLENAGEPYWIISKLQEDELVQIMERSALASIPKVPLTLAKAHLTNNSKDPEERMERFRRAIKLLRLRATIKDLEIMEAIGISEKFVQKCYEDAQTK
jgi:Family of unknown function (DUF6339)